MNYRITTEAEYNITAEEAHNQPEKFWSEIASHFTWKKSWDEVLRWDFHQPNVRWFDGAQLNITENLIDRHAAANPAQTALIWEPNDPLQANKRVSWSELKSEVNRLANGLRKIGVKKGDRICIYMPMVPELLYSMLASARIGAIHSVVFGGFSSVSLRERINDCGAAWVITADEIRRGEKNIGAKSVVDEALEGTACVKRVIVVQVSGSNTNMLQGRDMWMHDLCAGMPNECEPEIMNSEDPLFILYTSGSTGKPKGVVHSCGGYMVYAAWSFANVFQCRPGDLFWCTADAGWITGHSY
ncbi:MAG: AMP-binding protein, partial [Flavobacteriales bacterium]|nr:AMP-binding protein [Flavobacteriales bacterium]